MSTVLRSLRWTTITLVLASAASPPARAQDRPRIYSAPVLRALAMAADGYRTGRPVYFVMDMRPPERVVAVYGSREDANRSLYRDSIGFEVLGPFVTAPDARQVTRVVGITLVVMDSTGARTSFDVNPDSVDALFLTPTAVDRFLAPYYTWAFGPRAFLPRTLRPVCHAWGTFLCEARPEGIRIIGPDFRPEP